MAEDPEKVLALIETMYDRALSIKEKTSKVTMIFIILKTMKASAYMQQQQLEEALKYSA